MNNQLIQKIINTNNTTCPEFVYENSLIDRNVASALSRSFIKILRVYQQDSNLNNNVRYSILANIRQLCRIEPVNHLEIDENFTKSLLKTYMESVQINETINCIEQSLDDFLVRRMKQDHLNSNYQCTINPEVIQALLNLNESSSYIESICKYILHWNMCDNKNLVLVKKIWSNIKFNTCISTTLCDDMSIVMRSEIENSLLNICHHLLTEPNLKNEDVFSDVSLIDLVKKCSMSSECFQICSRILNYLFIHTNYNVDIQVFVLKFVKHVSMSCSESISTLYPAHLNPIVVLLDIDLDSLSNTLKHKFVERTLVHLKRLEEQSDLVLLLSHFPQWFPMYIL